MVQNVPTELILLFYFKLKLPKPIPPQGILGIHPKYCVVGIVWHGLPARVHGQATLGGLRHAHATMSFNPPSFPPYCAGGKIFREMFSAHPNQFGCYLNSHSLPVQSIRLLSQLGQHHNSLWWIPCPVQRIPTASAVSLAMIITWCSVSANHDSPPCTNTHLLPAG